MDVAFVGACAALGTALLGWLTLWLRHGDRLNKAQAAAQSALQTAAEAVEECKALTIRHDGLLRDFADYREQAIEKFVMHDTMLQFERRMVEAHGKSEQRLVDAIDDIAKRLDRLIEAGLRSPRKG